MNYKNIALFFIFVLISVLIYFRWENIIVKKREQDRGFICEQDIDIVFIGTSRTWYIFSPMYIWDKYGLVSYNRASSGQSYKVSYYIMKDAVENHNSKIIVFDISYLLDKVNPPGSFISDVSVMLPLKERFNAYKSTYANSFSYNKMNLASQFHSRWKELRNNDFIYYTFLKGQNINQSMNTYDGNIHILKSKVILFEDTINYAKLMQEYADSKGVKLIFITIPNIKSNHGYAEAFEDLAKKEGWIYFNYQNMIDVIHYNYKTDLCDTYHTNYYGGKKIMDNLIPYIIEHYNIPNRKNDPKYASWNEDYSKYGRAVNREEIRFKRSFQEWQNLAYYDNYTILISTNGDNVLNRLPQSMKDKFKTLGLNKFETDKKNQKYAAIIDNNQVFFEEISDKKVEYKGRMKNLVNLLVSSEFNKANINVSGKPRAKDKYGINFVIYDKVNREIVDSIWVDPAKPDEVRR